MLTRQNRAATTAVAATKAERRREEAAGRADRGLSHDRSDGDRDRRRADSAGRSEARRRFARAHPARAAERRGRHRHHHAEGSHSRQHAAGADALSHQDRRHSGGRGERWSRAVLGHRFRATTGKVDGIETREPAFNTAATWIEPACATRRNCIGYTVVEPAGVLATHLTETVPQACRRNSHPRRDEAFDRRAEENARRRWSMS